MTVRRRLTANQRARLLKDGGKKCAACGIGLAGKVWHLDHIRPLELDGADAPSNWQCLCIPCHADKTREDQGTIAKAKRREAIHLGAKPAPPRPLQGAPFRRSEKALRRQPKQPLPPKELFR